MILGSEILHEGAETYNGSVVTYGGWYPLLAGHNVREAKQWCPLFQEKIHGWSV